MNKDKETMKVIHDLKNPLIALQTILSYGNIDTEILNLMNFEINDLKEMLEVLRFEFKSKNGMTLEETKEYKHSIEFVKSIANTHKTLAENGNNALLISLDQFPEYMYISVSTIKRIINNFISNALKHTKDGRIKISFNKVCEIANCSEDVELIHKGSEINPAQEYLRFEIADNGKGIPADILPHIFDEMVSDQEGDNWDGTGLGLPICLKLAIS
mmetsp:Transcript_14110/g.11659  ORF Transcript_14110/g.11659 Transcript_14110/m.11659 type:complete len:215 (-) Transcript_14110:733-1377(-)